MNQPRTSVPIELAICAGCVALSVVATLSFVDSGWLARTLLLSAVIAAFVSLAMVRGRSFFKLTLSVSTLLLLIAAGSAMTGFASQIELLFFGLLPITALAGAAWATVQFFRLRTLQFAVELLCCFGLAGLVLIVGSRL